MNKQERQSYIRGHEDNGKRNDLECMIGFLVYSFWPPFVPRSGSLVR
jgi:hypothetical protein